MSATKTRACAVVSAGDFFKLETNAHQEVMREKRLGHMMLPAAPRARFVMIHTDFAFGFFQHGFNGPAITAGLRQPLMGTSHGRITYIEFQLWRPAQVTPEDRPRAWSGQLISDRGHSQEGKVSDQWPFAAFVNREALPRRRRQVGGKLAHFMGTWCVEFDARVEPRAAHRPTASRFDRRGTQPAPGIIRHFSQIPFAQGGDPIQKGWILPEMLIPHHPLKRDHMAGHHILKHLQRQRRFGSKTNGRWNVTSLPTRLVLGIKPVFRQIQAAIQEGGSVPTGIDQKDPFLTVGNLPYSPTVLARDACRMLALFGEATAIHDDNALRITERLGHQLLMTLDHDFARPTPTSNEFLRRTHRVRIGPQQRQDDRLDRFAFHIRQLPTQVDRRPISLLVSLKATVKVLLVIHQRLSERFLILPRQLQGRRATTRGRDCMRPTVALRELSHGNSLQSEIAMECIIQSLVVI